MTIHRESNAPRATPAEAQPDVYSERPTESLAARVEHLEAALEGLQDAVHRQAVLHDVRIDELSMRTEPHQMARALSRDARRHGV